MNNAPWRIPGLTVYQAKNFLGEQIYGRIREKGFKEAGKLTGMILEHHTVQELDGILQNEEAFEKILNKAQFVLETYSKPSTIVTAG
jgi:hypothetical protein